MTGLRLFYREVYQAEIQSVELICQCCNRILGKPIETNYKLLCKKLKFSMNKYRLVSLQIKIFLKKSS